MKTITIYENNILVGSGNLREYATGKWTIEGCPAVIPEDIYRGIEAAIDAGLLGFSVNGVDMTWAISEEED